jgi:hypothetical protein
MEKRTESTKKAARAKTLPTEIPLNQAELDLIENIKHGFEYDGMEKSLRYVFDIAVLESRCDIDATAKEHLFAMNELMKSLHRCSVSNEQRKLN